MRRFWVRHPKIKFQTVGFIDARLIGLFNAVKCASKEVEYIKIRKETKTII